MNRLIKSFGYALRGIRDVAVSERNMKIHLVISICVIIAGFCFNISTFEWIVILLCIGIVISAELFNTSIESMVDLASPNLHPLAKKTKDAAAGAVLVLAIISVIIGIIVFLPKIIYLF